MLDFIQTSNNVQDILKNNFKQKRLLLGFTQDGLSSRSGVSLGSLKRFEKSGQISLKSLLKLAVILDCLNEFINICKIEQPAITSMDKLINTKKFKIPKKGTIK